MDTSLLHGLNSSCISLLSSGLSYSLSLERSWTVFPCICKTLRKLIFRGVNWDTFMDNIPTNCCYFSYLGTNQFIMDLHILVCHSWLCNIWLYQANWYPSCLVVPSIGYTYSSSKNHLGHYYITYYFCSCNIFDYLRRFSSWPVAFLLSNMLIA